MSNNNKLNESLLQNIHDEQKILIASIIDRKIPIEWNKLVTIMESSNTELTKYVSPIDYQIYGYQLNNDHYMKYYNDTFYYHTKIESKPYTLKLKPIREDGHDYLSWYVDKKPDFDFKKSIPFQEAMTVAYKGLLATFDDYAYEAVMLTLDMKNENELNMVDNITKL
ncbi:MAG: hypothetical protein LUG12_12870 [Erysipelotrichaceae bacterium]|nr:hypothetical protein [Erysipelotrichaceae bacterium]